jgi:hypothetical protein
MKKIYSFLMALCLSVLMLNAKTVETTLWEGVYAGEIELNAATIASFKAGDILRVYVTVPEGGANFKIVYKGAPDWSETTIPSIGNQWPWVNGGETYKEFALTAEDLTAFAGKNIYIYKGDNSEITKVSLITEEKDTKETTLWEGEYTGEIELNAATVATFKADDILRVYVAASAEGGNFKLVYKGEPDWSETAIPSVNSTWPWINGGEDRFEVTFTDADIAALASMNIYLANGSRSIVKVSLLSENQSSTTGIDNANANVKATKIIRNGQVVIIRNNKEYSILGYEL